MPPALRERDYRLLFIGQAISQFGDGISPLAVAFAVLALTGQPAALGVVLAARMVPMLGLLLAGGVCADRRSRRSVLLAADVARALSQGATAALLLTGTAEVWQLALLQAVHGSASAFFMPASSGLLPELLDAHNLQEANALRGITQSLGASAGPLIAGVLVTTAGSGWAIAADAATFALSAMVLVRLPAPPASVRAPRNGAFLDELKDGWLAFRAHTWVCAGVCAAAVANMVFAGYLVLAPALARAHLGGASAWALISSAFGAGMLLGGLTGLRAHPERPLRAVAALLSLIGAPSLALAAGAPALLAAAAALSAGVAFALLNAIWETALQQRIPRQVLSRVTAYDWLGSLALQPVGYLAAGAFASVAGLRTTLVCITLLSVLSGAALLAVGEARAMRSLALT